MTGPPPPLRFLLVVVGGWALLRGAYLGMMHDAAIPTARPHPVLPGAPHPPPTVSSARVAEAVLPGEAPPAPDRLRGAHPQTMIPVAPRMMVARPARPGLIAAAMPVPAPPPSPASEALVQRAPWPLPSPALRVGEAPVPDRWTASGWLHLRRGGSDGLAPGGTLGGSQAGARFGYRLGAGLGLSARLYSPVRRPQGAEAALGVEWQPLRRVPVRLLAERRQRIGREGRSDFALMAYGGVSEQRLPGGLRLEAYGQAGVVGVRARDGFADGAAAISARIGPLDVGGGAWAAAQPGVSRLDVGPRVSMRLPIAGTGVRVSADWRFRVAGEAAPSSGPALTVGTDF